MSALLLGCPGAGAGGGGGGSDDGGGGTDDTGGTEPRPELKEIAEEIVSGSGSSYPAYFTGFDGAVYFAAEDSANGEELWKFDGTEVSIVEDIYAGGTSSSPDDFVVFDGSLYFQAENSANGMELFKLDGDGNGASLAADIDSGGGDGYWGNPIVYEEALYFQATDGSSGKNLFKYDGSSASFVAEVTFGDSSFPADLTLYDNTFYMYAEENGGTISADAELYYFDSATEELTLPGLEEVNPTGTGSLPEELVVYDGNLYFEADSNDGAGRELYMYDNGDSDNDNEIYERITNIRSGNDAQIGNATVFDGELYFTAYDGVRDYIYSYDGTSVTTHQDIVDGHTPYYPGSLEVYDGQLYFSAEDGTHGRELWRFDGQNAELVWDINQGSDDSYPYGMTAIDGRLYFSADNGSSGEELFYYQSPKP